MRALDGVLQASPCRSRPGASGRARKCRACGTSRAAWRTAPTKNAAAAAGLSGGFRRTAAPVDCSISHVTLLTESSRRVGTAWPNAVCKGDCGARKAAAKDSRKLILDAMLHCAQPEFPRICRVHRPKSPFHRASGRFIPRGGNPVEFVNHTESRVTARRARGGQCACGQGLGSSFKIWDFGRSASCALSEVERDSDDASLAPYDGLIPRTRLFYP
jgi:hypothetical protein